MFKRITTSSITAFVISILSAHSYAMAPGPYIGISMGPASNDASERTAYTINYQIICPKKSTVPCSLPGGLPAGNPASYSTILAKPKSTQFGSRIMLGYQFNNYAAVEAGFNYFSTIRYTTTPSTCSLPPGTPPNGPYPPGPTAGSGGTVIQNSNPCSPSTGTGMGVRNADIVLKGSIPLQYFNLYGKIGPAYVITNTEGAFYQPLVVSNQNPGNPIPVPAKSVTKYFFKPIIAIGADYTISQSWVADLSWTHLSVGNGAGSINYIGLGIAYHFVDRFCGQFLCND